MSDENNTVSYVRPKAIVDLHGELIQPEPVEKLTPITEDEAKTIAEKYLKHIHGVHLCSLRCGRSIWEHNLYVYAHQRLEMLIDSGLITDNYIDEWRKANVVPMGDLRNIDWRDRNVDTDGLYVTSFSILDSDDEIPF